MHLPAPAKWRSAALAVVMMISGAALRLPAQTPQNVVWWQSFTTPTSAFQQVLTEIGFTGLSTANGQFGVYAFNGTYLTGGILWHGSQQNIQSTDVLRFYPSITLAPNTLYALALEFPGSPNWGASQGVSDVYSGGQYYTKSGPTSSQSPFGTFDYQGFEVQFQDVIPVTPTPEPASVLLLATGLLAMEGLRRRRHHRIMTGVRLAAQPPV